MKLVERTEYLRSYVVPAMMKMDMRNMKSKKCTMITGKIITGIPIVRVEGDGNVIRKHFARNIRKIENMLI